MGVKKGELEKYIKQLETLQADIPSIMGQIAVGRLRCHAGKTDL